MRILRMILLVVLLLIAPYILVSGTPESLETLPKEIIHEIMGKLPYKDSYNLATVYKLDENILNRKYINPLEYHSSKYANADIQKLLDSHELSIEQLEFLKRKHVVYSLAILEYLVRNNKLSDLKRIIGEDEEMKEIAFIYASKYGIQEIFDDLILQVYPGLRGNLALLLACQNGHFKIVKKLLGVVDPVIPDNLSLLLAAQNGHLKIVKDLLQDGRVDPTWNNYIAASRALQNQYRQVADLIALDERIDLEDFSLMVHEPICLSAIVRVMLIFTFLLLCTRMLEE